MTIFTRKQIIGICGPDPRSVKLCRDPKIGHRSDIICPCVCSVTHLLLFAY